jgi:Tol biopolymer transport system component
MAFHFADVDVPAEKPIRHISVLDVGTGSVREVYSGIDGTGNPVWSPDGKSLLVLCGLEAMSTGGEGGRDLGILSVLGGKVERLNVKIDWPTGDGYQHTLASPDWSPDGTKIAFTAHSVKNELYLMKKVIPPDKKE